MFLKIDFYLKSEFRIENFTYDLKKLKTFSAATIFEKITIHKFIKLDFSLQNFKKLWNKIEFFTNCSQRTCLK